MLWKEPGLGLVLIPAQLPLCRAETSLSSAPRGTERTSPFCPPHTGVRGLNTLQGARSLGVRRGSSGPISFRTQGSSEAFLTGVYPPSHEGEGSRELSNASVCWMALICFLVGAETCPALVLSHPGHPGCVPSHGWPCRSSKVVIGLPFVGPSPGLDSSAALHVSNPSSCSSPELSPWLPHPPCAARERGPIRSLASLEHNGLPQSDRYTPINAAYAQGSFLAGVSHGWLMLSLRSAKPPRSFSHKRFSFGK